MLDALLLMEHLPEIRWKHDDDLCDCTFQRIGWWTNPYLGRTLEVRLCCAWKALAALFPEVAACMREIPAFDNYNTDQWETEPHEWNGDFDMPRAIWYRHLAAKTGKSLEEIRREYNHLNAPKAVIKDGCEHRGPAADNRGAGGADTGSASRGPARGRRTVPVPQG